MSPSPENIDGAGGEPPADLDSILDALARLSVFGALSRDTISYLLERCEEVAVAKGDAFFRQGESSDCVFVLRRGRIEVVRTAGTRSVVLAELDQGALFGEMALVGISPRTATARALEDCLALKMPHHVMLELSKHNLHDFALLQMNLAREIARRLAVADQTLLEHFGREQA